MTGLVAFLVGLVFAIGLGVGGMTQPPRVQAFLDVAGRWDPTLAFVMAGAVAVYAVAARQAKRLAQPLYGGTFAWPTRRDVDRRLVVGAALFGVGWGLTGLCPGPAITALGSGQPVALVFVAAMVAGMALEGVGREPIRALATAGIAGASAIALGSVPAMTPIAPADLHSHSFLVVDVRSPAEYAAGHVPGARNVLVGANRGAGRRAARGRRRRRDRSLLRERPARRRGGPDDACARRAEPAPADGRLARMDGVGWCGRARRGAGMTRCRVGFGRVARRHARWRWRWSRSVRRFAISRPGASTSMVSSSSLGSWAGSSDLTVHAVYGLAAAWSSDRDTRPR